MKTQQLLKLGFEKSMYFLMEKMWSSFLDLQMWLISKSIRKNGERKFSQWNWQNRNTNFARLIGVLRL